MLKFLYLILILFSNPLLAAPLPLEKLQLPPGFSISIYAHVPEAREMALGKNGTVFVGTFAGKVYALVANKNQIKVMPLLTGLTYPNGVAIHNNDLYVAEPKRILKYTDIENNLNSLPKPIVINNQLPDKGGHNWRYIAFGPDNKLYVSIGAPCNTCLSQDARFASIIRMNADGTEEEIYASGVRNSVGFDWDPKTNLFWFTDNGRDWLGDYAPPDELNVAREKGLHFGFPFYNGFKPDPTYGKLFPATKFTIPALSLPAHVAALGMIFYTGNMFPSHWQNQVFIAEHGSWNRTTKDGYQVVSVQFKNGKPTAPIVFIRGWLQGNSAWGRPVDFLILKDGSLLISDDHAGVIYRVTYTSKDKTS